MTAHLAHIRRHPVKSVGGEGLDRVTLSPASRMPGDREWAVLTEAGQRHAGEGEPGRWLPKSCFVRGAAAPALQAVRGGIESGTGGDRLTFRHPALPDLSIDPAREGARLLDWLAPLWPAGRAAPTRLIRGAGIWTDVKWPWVSILSLSSLRALETRLGRTLGIDRWRGNLWIAGWPPFAEIALIGQVLAIGPVRLRVTEPIGRCEATSVDAGTGRPEADMPALLDRLYGSRDFGVYAEVTEGGEISIGQRVAA